MKKIFIGAILLFLHFRLAAQQFSQYNTGTLYDSFENPAQNAFIADSSRQVAFNLFVPNFNADFTLSGNVQSSLKNRLFLSKYVDDALTVGQQNFNYLRVNSNAYLLMLKFYSSINCNCEFGLSWQTKLEGRGVFSDESVQILADNSLFTANTYNDAFNTRFSYQGYHQISLSFRQDIDQSFAFGIKLSALLGVVNNIVNINSSSLSFDRTNDKAFLSLTGNFKSSFEPGSFKKSDLLPGFDNPGASVSLGVSYLTENKVKLQFNLKDLGFIHWNSMSLHGDFDNTGIINGLSQAGVEDSVARVASALVQRNVGRSSFTTPTDGRFEASASQSFWLNDNRYKYTPTLILSKELFYPGFAAAFVNHLQYHSLVGTVTASYDDMHYTSVGLQFMVKTPNTEFFLGTDRFLQTTNLITAAINAKPDQTFTNYTYTGANFFIGFAMKLGPVPEHRENSSYVPLGDHRNFVTRFWQRIRGQQD